MSETPARNLGVETRQGLPSELRFLIEKYPRAGWQAHENLGEMAKFWLQRHDMFRRLGGMLVESLSGFREGKTGSEEFASFFVPRLNMFLSQLDGHHQIEDAHYFPVFRAADMGLVAGFDILDADHHAIHGALERNAELARSFLGALGQGGDDLRFASDAYASETDLLISMLTRHLEDEEDLIVPMVLERGEVALGVR